MNLNDETILTVAGIVAGITCVPYSIMFFTLFIVGRIATPEDDRSDIGTWFGYFSLVMGFVMLCLAGLYLGRWIDFDADRAPQWFITTMATIGALALLAGIPVAFKLAPLAWKEMKRAKDRK